MLFGFSTEFEGSMKCFSGLQHCHLFTPNKCKAIRKQLLWNDPICKEVLRKKDFFPLGRNTVAVLMAEMEHHSFFFCSCFKGSHHCSI